MDLSVDLSSSAWRSDHSPVEVGVNRDVCQCAALFYFHRDPIILQIIMISRGKPSLIQIHVSSCLWSTGQRTENSQERKGGPWMVLTRNRTASCHRNHDIPTANKK